MSPPDDAALAAVEAVRAEGLHRCLIVLDVDGTLAPIVEDPAAARALDGTATLLRRLAAAGATVALVTGRPAVDAVAMTGLADADPVEVLGLYGLERWRAGQLETPEVAAGVTELRERLPAELVDAPDGVHVEDKGHSLVVHARRTADPQATLSRLQPRLERLARSLGLEVMPGRAVLELHPPGLDKGAAMRVLLDAHRPAVGVFVGDDVADVAAATVLRAAAGPQLRAVVVASVDPATPDTDPAMAGAADVVLAGPAAVLAWLGQLLGDDVN